MDEDRVYYGQAIEALKLLGLKSVSSRLIVSFIGLAEGGRTAADRKKSHSNHSAHPRVGKDLPLFPLCKVDILPAR